MDYDDERQGLADDYEAPPRPTRFDDEDDEVEPGDTPPRRASPTASVGERSQENGHPQAEGLRERPSRCSGTAASSPTASAAGSEKRAPQPPAPTPLSPFDPLALALLSAFSILGCLCRLGLTALFSYAGQSVLPLVWSQAVGSFLMGLALRSRTPLENSYIGPALYVGWTTGLCGSITTFSSWMLQTFGAWSNINRFPRSGVHDAVDGVAQILITLAVSFFSLHFGRRFAHYLPTPASRVPSRSVQYAALALGVAVYLAAILALALSDADWTGHRVLFAVVLAPPGTVLRWWLARLNKLSERVPTMGTLTANLLATLVLAISYLLQRIVPVGQGLSGIQCQALQAIEDGFCGSLSTISTFMTELDALASRGLAEHERLAAARDAHSTEAAREAATAGKQRMGWLEREAVWVYGAASVISGILVMILVLGIGWWASPRGLGARCSF